MRFSNADICTVEAPRPDDVVCDFERSNIARVYFDEWQARQSIEMFCNGESQSWDVQAKDMTVEPNPTYKPGDAQYPSRWYYYGYPTVSLNISVGFADVVKANQLPGADDIYPSNSDCNNNAPQVFRVVDHQAECLGLLDALEYCESLRGTVKSTFQHLLTQPA
jgi:hypothetical protein